MRKETGSKRGLLRWFGWMMVMLVAVGGLASWGRAQAPSKEQKKPTSSAPPKKSAPSDKSKVPPRPTSKTTTVSRPAARPQARPAPCPPSTSPPGTRHRYEYDLIFKGKKVGKTIRVEVFQPKNKIQVKTSTELSVKILFFKINSSSKGEALYEKGKLMRFSLKTTFRGKRSVVSGYQIEKGLKVVRKADGKTKTKIFPSSAYDSTSLDLRFTGLQPGRTVQRKNLNIPRLKVVEQTIKVEDGGQQKVFGSKRSLLLLKIKGKRGHGQMIITRDGRLVNSKFKGHVGQIKIRLASWK